MRDDDPDFLDPEDSTPPIPVTGNWSGSSSSGASLNIRIEGVPLVEGPNYFSLTYTSENIAVKTRPYATTVVTLDTVPPGIKSAQLNGDPVSDGDLKAHLFNPAGLSPNGDRVGGLASLWIVPTEPGVARMTIVGTDGRSVTQWQETVSDQQVNRIDWNGGLDLRIPSRSMTSSMAVPDGRYTAQLVLSDLAGNVADQWNWPLIVDNTSPVIRSISCPDSVSLHVPDSLADWMIGADDASGIGSVKVAVSGAISNNIGVSVPPSVTGSITIPGVSGVFNGLVATGDGTAIAVITVVDRLGNATVVTRNIRIDSQVPVWTSVVVNGRVPGQWAIPVTGNRMTRIEAVATDIGSSVPLTFSGRLTVGENSKSLSVSTTGNAALIEIGSSDWIQNALNYVTISVSDGLQSSEYTVTINADTVPPVVTTASIPGGVSMTSRVPMMLGFSELVTGTLRLTTGNTVRWSASVSGNRFAEAFVPTRSIADGVYSLDLQFKDRAGNGASWQQTIILDSTAPSVNFMGLSRPISPSVDIASVIVPTVTDASPVTVSVSWLGDGQSVDPVAFVQSGAGNRMWGTARAIDGAGNEGTASVMVRIDRFLPTIHPIQSTMITSRNTVILSVIADDPDHFEPVQVKVSNGLQTVTTSVESGATVAIPFQIPSGNSVVLLDVRDSVGRTATTSIDIVLDDILPQVNLIMPTVALRLSSDDTVAIRATLSESVKRATVTWQGQTRTVQTQGLGLYERVPIAGSMVPSVVSVRVEDLAGNATTVTQAIRILAKVPTVSIGVLQAIGSTLQPILAAVDTTAVWESGLPSASVHLSLQRVAPDGMTLRVMDLGEFPPSATVSRVSIPVSADWPDSDRYTLLSETMVDGQVRESRQFPTGNVNLVVSNRPLDCSEIQLTTPVVGPVQPILFAVPKNLPIRMATYRVGESVVTASVLLSKLPVADSVFEGPQKIQIEVVSLAGIVATRSFTVRVDRQAPKVTVTPASGVFKPYEQGQFVLLLAADEAVRMGSIRGVASGNTVEAVGPGITAISDRQIQLTWTGKRSPTQALPDGEYTLQIPVMDDAGNVTTGSSTVQLRNDFPAVWIDSDFEAMNPAKGPRSVTVKLSGSYAAVSLKLVDAQTQSVVRTLVSNRALSGDTVVNFDGKSESGTVLSDGIYEWVVAVKQAAGDTDVTNRRRLVIRSKAPVMNPKLGSAQVRPGSIPLNITNLTVDSAWIFRVELVSKSDQVLAKLIEKPRYSDLDIKSLNWPDLSAVAGGSLIDGDYRLRITAIDEAQNETSTALDFNLKSTMSGSVGVALEKPYMTPNLDGVYDYLGAKISVAGSEPEYLLAVHIDTVSGRRVRDLMTKTKVTVSQPTSVRWNGLDDSFLPAGDGEYVLGVELNYLDGSVAFKSNTPFVSVAQLPTMSVAAATVTVSATGVPVTILLPMSVSPVLRNSAIVDTSVRVSGTLSGGVVAQDGFQILARDTAQLTITPMTAGTLSDGTYPLTVILEDPIGNRVVMDHLVSVCIDSTPPVQPQVTWIGNPTVNSSELRLKIVAESGPVAVLVNGGTTVNIGLNTVIVQSTDSAGNVSPMSAPLNFWYDPISPVVTSTTVGRSALALGQSCDVGMEFSESIVVSPTASIQLVVSGQPVVSAVATQTSVSHISGIVSLNRTGIVGVGTVVVSGVTDLAGNDVSFGSIQSGMGSTAMLLLDSDVPAVPSMSVGKTLVSENSVTLAMVSTGADSIEVSVNGQIVRVPMVGTGNGSTTLTSLVSGQNSVSIRSKDLMGNLSDWAAPVTVIWDTVPISVVSIMGPVAATHSVADVMLTASKPIYGSVVATLGNGTFGGTVSGNQVRFQVPIPEGTEQWLTLTVPQLSDDVGYRTHSTLSFWADRQLPSATVPQPTWVTTGLAVAPLSMTEPVSVVAISPSTVSVTGDAVLRLTMPVNNSTDQGPTTVNLTVSDRAGNIRNLMIVPWIVDTQSPVMTWTHPMSGPVSTGDVVIRLTASEVVSTPSISVGGVVLVPIEKSEDGGWLGKIRVTSVLDGSQPVIVTAMDSVGNTRTQTVGTVAIDTSRPRLSGIPSGASTPSIGFEMRSSEPIGSIHIWANGAEIPVGQISSQSVSVEVPGSYPDGPVAITGRVGDLAGNMTLFDSLGWQLDRRPPTIAAQDWPTTVGVGDTHLRVVTSELTPSLSMTLAGVRVEPIMVLGNVHEFLLPVPVNAPSRPVNVEVTAMDVAGNETRWSQSLVIDTTAPQVVSMNRLLGPIGPGLFELSVTMSEPVTLNQAFLGSFPLTGSITGNRVTLTAMIPTSTSQGNARLYIEYQDSVGNVATTVLPGWIIDTMAPVVELDLGTPIIVSTGPIFVTINVSEWVASASATLVGRPMALISSRPFHDGIQQVWASAILSTDPQGTAPVTLSVADAAGNRTVAVIPVVTVDSILPTLNWTREIGMTSAGTVRFEFTTSEPLMEVASRVNGQPGELEWTTPTAGAVVVRVSPTVGMAQWPVTVTAMDFGGNVSVPLTQILGIDTVPIRFESMLIPTRPVSVGIPTIHCSLSEPPVSVRVTGISATTRIVGNTVDIFPEVRFDSVNGGISFKIELQDLVGNRSVTDSILVVDTIAPTAQLTALRTDTNQPTVSVTLVGEPGTLFTVFRGNQSMVTGNFVTTTASVNVPLLLGNNFVSVQVVDLAGNSTRSSVTQIGYRTEVPRLDRYGVSATPAKMGLWQANLAYNEPVFGDIDAILNLGAVTISAAIDRPSPTDIRVSVMIPDGVNGIGTLTVNHIENGATTTTSATIPIEVDTRAPAAMGSLSGVSYKKAGVYSFETVLSEVVATISATFNDRPLELTMAAATTNGTVYQFAIPIPTTEHQGTASIQIQFIDAAGNSGSSSDDSWIVDTSPPTSSIGSIPTRPISIGMTLLTLTTSELTRRPSLQFNGREMTVSDTGSGLIWLAQLPIVASDPQGPSAVTVSIEDRAGNASVTQWVGPVIDTEVPKILSIPTEGSPRPMGIYSFLMSISEPGVSVSGSVGPCPLTVSQRIPTGAGEVLELTYEIVPTTRQGLQPVSLVWVDPAGNTSQASYGHVDIDTISPVGVTTPPDVPFKKSGKYSYDLTISETVPTISATFNGVSMGRLGSAPTANGVRYEFEFEISPNARQGTASIQVSFADAAGNAGSVTDGSWIVDTLIPTIESAPAEFPTQSMGHYSVALRVSERGVTISGTVGNSPMIEGSRVSSGVGDLVTLYYDINGSTPQGRLPISIRLADSAGNISQGDYGQILVDTIYPTLSNWPTGPVVRSTGPWHFTIQSDEVLQSLTATVNGRFAMAQTSGNIGIWDVLDTVPVGDIQGSVTMTVVATDLAGNTSVVTPSFAVVDTRPPVVTVTRTSPSIQSVGVVTMTIGLDAPVDSLNATLDGASMLATRVSGNEWLATGLITSASIQGVSKVTVVATDFAGNVTPVSMDGPIIDTVFPTATDLPSATAYWKQGQYTIPLTISEVPLTVTADINGRSVDVTVTGTQLSTAISIPSTEPQGPSMIRWHVTDLAGNRSDVVSDKITIDTRPPVVTVTRTSPSIQSVGVVTMTIGLDAPVDSLNATLDGASMLATRVSGNEWLATGLITSASIQGVSKVTVVATDFAGNVTPVSMDGPIIDTVFPTATDLPSATAYWKQGQYTIPLTISEVPLTVTADINGRSVDVTVTGTQLSTAISIPSTEPQGPSMIRWHVTDLAGNRSDVVSDKITIDTRPPVVTVTRTSPSIQSVGVVTMTIGLDAPVDSLNATLDGASMLATRVSGNEWLATGLITSASIQGVSKVTVVATDFAGNVTPVSMDGPIIDTVFPTATDLPSATAYWKQGQYTIPLTISEVPLTVTADINGRSVDVTVTGTQLSTAISIPSTEPQGPSMIRWHVTDLAGNRSDVVSDKITIDTVVPTLSVGAATPLIRSTGVMTVTLNVSEPNASVAATWNGTGVTVRAVTSTTFAVDLWVTNTTPQGDSVLNLMVTDRAGNRISTATVVAVIDTITPQVTGTVGSPVYQSIGNLAIPFSTSEPVATVTVTVNGRLAIVSGTYLATLPISSADAQGTASVQIRVQDFAGNSSQTTIPYYCIDTVIPVISGLPTQSQWVSTGNWTLHFKPNEWVATPSVTMNGRPMTISTITPSGTGLGIDATISILNGDTQGAAAVVITAIDIAGNASTVTFNGLSIDTVLPTVTATRVQTSAGVEDLGALYLSDKQWVLTFSEPVTPGTITLGSAVAQITQPQSTQLIASFTQSQLSSVAGTQNLTISGVADRAGNRNLSVVTPYFVDVTAPTIQAVTVNTQKLMTPMAIAAFNSQAYKAGLGDLTVDIKFSESVVPGRMGVMVMGVEKTLILQSTTSNAQGFFARYSGALSATDFGYLSDLNLIDAQIVPIGVTDIAGNTVPETQKYPFTLDLAAPVITDKGADNGLSVGKNDPYYGVIKPYDVSGQQDQLRLWFTLNEVAWVSKVRIMQVSPNVAVRTITDFTRTGADSGEFSFVWDGRNNSGALVGSNRSDSFYYIQIDAQDRAGNPAVLNTDGYIKVLHMELGVKWASPLPVIPVSPKVQGPLILSVLVEAKDYPLPTSADFKLRYPDLPYKIFSDPVGPRWGTYKMTVRPNSGGAVVGSQTGSISSPFIPFAVTWDGAAPDGLYTIEVIASDNAGNMATVNATGTICIDTTAPSLTASIAPDYVNYGTIPVSITVSDGTDPVSAIQVFNSGTLINNGVVSIPFAANGSLDGSKLIQFQAVDRAGNRSVIVSDSVILDTIAPVSTVSWTTGQSSPIVGVDREVSGNFTLTVSPVDTNSDHLTVNLGGLSQTVVGASNTVTFGTQTWNKQESLSITAVDKAGNQSTRTYGVIFDNQAPAFGSTTIPQTTRQTSIAVPIPSVVDASFPVTIETQLDSNSPVIGATLSSAGSTTVTIPFLSQGSHSIRIVAVDRLGNRSAATVLTTNADWTAPTLTLSPVVSGWSRSSIGTISLTGFDSGVGVSRIRYRWDDATLSTGATNVNAATTTTVIPSEGSHTLNADVTDLAENSTTAAQTFRQDTQPPILGVSYSASGWQRVPIPTITLQLTDPSPGSGLQSAFVSWDLPNPQLTGVSATHGQTVTMPSEGTHQLMMVATDTAGNTSTSTTVYQVDTVAPTGSADKSSSAWLTSSIGGITVSAADTSPGSGLAFAKYRWDNSVVADGTLFTSGSSVTIVSEGAHTLTIQSTDTAGNTSTLWQGTYKQDTVAPIASASQSLAAWRTASVVPVLSGTDASPGSGLSTLRYRWDNTVVDSGTLASSGDSVTIPGDGSHTLYVKATDAAGNGTVWSGSYNLDRQAPIVSADKSGSGWWTTAIGNITLAVSEPAPGSGLALSRYRWDNPDVDNGTGYVQGQTITIPGEGDHTLYLKAWDVAGNSSAVWVGTYRQDTQIPVGSATQANPNWVVTNIGSVVLTATDSSPGSGLQRATYRWDNTDIDNGTYFTNGAIITIPSEGSHQLRVKAWDTAGNTSSVWSGMYQQDTVAPVITANKSSSDWVRSSLGLITISVSDTVPGSGLAVAKYAWENTDVLTVGTSVSNGGTVSIPGEGDNCLYMMSVDTAGNRSLLGSGRYKVDTQKPVVSADKTSTVWRTTAIGAITISVSDGSPGSGLKSTKYRWDNIDLTGGTAVTNGTTITVPNDGDHTLTIQADDTAGNISDLWQGKYKQDTVAPVITVNFVQEAWKNSIAELILQVSDTGGSAVASTQYRWNTGVWQNWTAGAITAPPDGDNTLTVVAVDGAGNSKTWTGIYRVDRVAPVVSETTVTPVLNPMRDGDMTITFKTTDNVCVVVNSVATVVRSDGTVVKTFPSSSAANGALTTLRWDGKNDSGTYVLEGSYFVKLSVNDGLNTTVANTGSFSVSYMDEVATFDCNDAWFKKADGIQWGPIAGDKSITIRISTDGITWTNGYRVDSTAPIVDMTSVTQNQSLQVFYTDTATAKKYRIWLPKAYEGFSGIAITLKQGFNYKWYQYDEKSYTPFVTFNGESVITGADFNFDFGDGANSAITNGNTTDWWAHIESAYIKVPDNLAAGIYRLRISHDDGLTIWWNGKLIASNDMVSSGEYSDEIIIEPGAVYPIIIWYNELWGTARQTISFYNSAGAYPALPMSAIYTEPVLVGVPPNSSKVMTNDMLKSWVSSARCSIFDNNVNGGDRRLRGWRTYDTYTLDWGGGHPGNSMDDDYWSMFLTSSFFIRTAGEYRFQIGSDDGHDFYLDGVDLGGTMGNYPESTDVSKTLGVGFHPLTVALHEERGLAYISMGISRKLANGTYESYPATGGNRSIYFQPDGTNVNDLASIKSVPSPIASTTAAITLISPSQTQQTGPRPTMVWDSSVETVSPAQIRFIPYIDWASASRTQSVIPTSPVTTMIPASTGSAVRKQYTLQSSEGLAAGVWAWQVLASTPTGDVLQSPVETFEVIPELSLTEVMNYPNPFKMTTKLRYKLSASVDRVTLSLFTVSGHLVRRIDGPTEGASAFREYHDVTWDGCNDDGEPVVNGVYILKVAAESSQGRKEVRTKVVKMR